MALKTQGEKPGVFALTVDELRERKRAVTHLICEAETKADELRRQADMYREAAGKLGVNLARAEDQAQEAAARGDQKTAADLQAVAGEIRGPFEKNSQLAEERSHLADERQQEVDRQKGVLAKIEALIQSRQETVALGDRT